MRGFIQIGDGVANLTADAAPDSTTTRFETLPPWAYPNSGFIVYLKEGTSIDAQPYVKDPKSGLWMPVAASQTVAAGAIPKTFLAGDFRECPAFIRLTSPVGNAKTVLWRYA